MRNTILFTMIFGLILSSCNHKYKSKTSIEKPISGDYAADKTEVQNLIRQVLNWADSQNSIYLLPIISDSTDSIYIGFDLNVLKSNLDKLRDTNLFAKEFIENYNQIIITLDENIKNKVYHEWLVGELQPFGFGNDVNPWCYCQEIPYDNPSPWELVEITVINFDKDKGELTWTWGKTDWSDIKYRFRVTKESGKWKISYMQGFDYNESIKGA